MSLFGPEWEYSGERLIGDAPGYEHRWFSEMADGNWIVARVTTEVQGLTEAQALEILAAQSHPSPDLDSHIESCATCRTGEWCDAGERLWQAWESAP